ncbi:uncharacterized protein LOC111599546 [Drosophila hydei]|uniref:Uncharacterized protein LOC111599546 n=1 Tax=Drosophila hydei TaxID=7224 RepID=A0A6J1LSW9_DROHY|nr:uncharacterized protein LOC111599546 [Drosophila hydei]
MNSFNTRQFTHSEFAFNTLSNTAREMRANRLATDLLRHEEHISRNLSERRSPTYGEFRKLVRDVHGQSSVAIQARQVNVYESFKNLHRRRMDRNILKNIKSSIITKLRVNNNTNSLDFKSMYGGLALKRDLLRNNLTLLCRMNGIYRVKGCVDSFTHEPLLPSANNLKLKQDAVVLINANTRLGCRLLNAKSKVDTFNPWRPASTPEHPPVNNKLVQKYSSYMPIPLDTIPRQSPIQLLRPIIYYDLAVRPQQFLGRICIQLYTEVSPEVVLEFVRLATENDVQAHKFTRIFSDLWLEGQLMPSSKDALKDHHDHPSPLDASRRKGVLSYSWNHRQRFPNGLLVYTISFKTLAVKPLNRVCFGVVMKGLRLLEICRDFGTHRGTPKKRLEIVKCGLLT